MNFSDVSFPDVSCVFLFGDCVLPSFDARKQPFDVGLFFNSTDPNDIPDLTNFKTALKKKNARLGYLLPLEMVTTGADTFPLEFLNLAHRYKTVHGEFPLQGFVPNSLALRHQCERELRGLYIHLIREYALHEANNKELQDMFLYTMPQFIPIFQGIFWLFNEQKFPKENREILAFVDQFWQFNSLFDKIQNPPKDLQELKALARNYILAIETIVKSIDRLEIKS